MNLRSISIAQLLAGVLAAQSLYAQQNYALDKATINRLGLVFSEVSAFDNSSGTRLPALVIPSPEKAASIFTAHDGIIEQWNVKAGQTVEAGAVLAVLRSSAVTALQQDWISARAADQQALVAVTRDRALFENGIIARQRLQESERIAEEAHLRKLTIEDALEQVGYFSAEREGLVKGVGLGRYRIKAPFAGVAGSLEHRTGESVKAGEHLLTLVGKERWLSAELPASVGKRIIPGAKLRIEGFDTTLTARQIETALDASTQTVELIAEFDAPVTLSPGKVVTLLLPPQAEGVLVPATAVVHNKGSTVVYVRNAQGVEARTLQLESAGADYLAVEGLHAGEQVAVRGTAVLKGISLGLGGE